MRSRLAVLAAFLHRLKYSQKFVLISLLFLVPLGISLYLLVREQNIAINFGRKEIEGTAYLRPLRHLLEDAQHYRWLEYRAQNSETTLDSEIARAREAIEAELDAIDAATAQYGASLRVEADAAALRVSWQGITARARQFEGQTSYQQQTAFIDDIQRLMARAGDTSNLILDPDLNSYYMMDAVLLKLPDGQRRLSDLLLLAHHTARVGRLTADERVELIVLSGLLRSNTESLRLNVLNGMNNDPSGSLRPALNKPLEATTTATERFLELVDQAIINAGAIEIDPNAVVASGQGALDASFAFYDQASPALEQLIDQRVDRFVRNQITVLTIVLAFVTVAFLLGLSVMRAISRPLDNLIQATHQLAAGDMTARVRVSGEDEAAQVGRGFNHMAEQLQMLIERSEAGVQTISTAAGEILATASQHSASASEQSAATQQTTATVDEVRAVAEQSAHKAEDVAALAQTSVRVSQEGAEAIAAIIQEMQDLRQKMQAIAQDILALSDQTQLIAEITVTVNDLADQSNLLALNAAIEAAKAGEQGKGFAVVAAEVRTLAEQSKQATNKVRAILGSIQKATQAAVLATEQGNRGVETSLTLTRRAGTVIGELEAAIGQAAQAAVQISALARQQSVGMDQIAQAMREINQATTQFVAGAGQSQAAAEGLNGIAHQLRSTIERQTNGANGAHRPPT